MADISSNPVVDWGGMVSGTNLQNAQAGQAQQAQQLTQQQTQAAQMQNQLMKARMPLIMNAISDYSDDASNESTDKGGPTVPSGATGEPPDAQADTSGANPESSESPETSWYNPQQIDAHLRSQFFVPPVTPQEAQKIQKAAFVDPKGEMGLLESAKQQRQLRIDAQTGQSQYGSNNLFEAMHAVVDADSGHALAQLTAVAPDTAKRIKEMIPDEADEDAAARSYAAHVAGVAHQYSGRETVADNAGVYRDKVTGMTVPGVEKSGLSEDQWANLAKSGSDLVDFNDGQGHVTKIERWKANKAPSLSSWVMQMAAHAGVFSAQPTIGGAPKMQARASAQQGIDTAAAQNAKVAGAANTPVSGTTTTNGSPDPAMSKALADHDFDYAPPVQKFGTSLSPDEQKDKDNQVEARKQLKQTADSGVPAAQQALTFYKAAQDILDSKGANTGKWTTILAHAGAYIPGVQVPTTTNYQELAKYLANAALQAGKGIFPKMTQKEGDWIMNKLNPSPEMNEGAVRNMLANGQKMSQYTLDSAQRVGAFIKTGKDATRFNAWNAKNFPEPEFVTPTKTAAGAVKGQYSDAQISAWAAAHKVDLSKARAFFGAK